MQVRNHLRDCRCCSDEYESLLLTKRMVSGVSLKAPRSCLEDRILGRIAEEKTPGSAWHNVTGWWSLMAENQRSNFRTVALFGVFCTLSFVYVLNPFRRPVSNQQFAADLRRMPSQPAILEPAPADYFRYQMHSQSGEPFSSGPAAVPASFRTDQGP